MWLGDSDNLGKLAEQAVATFPKPLIARIDRYCLGGGIGLAAG